MCEDVLAINSGHCLARNVPEAFLVDGLHRAEEDISLFRVGEAPPVALPKASTNRVSCQSGGGEEREREAVGRRPCLRSRRASAERSPLESPCQSLWHPIFLPEGPSRRAVRGGYSEGQGLTSLPSSTRTSEAIGPRSPACAGTVNRRHAQRPARARARAALAPWPGTARGGPAPARRPRTRSSGTDWRGGGSAKREEKRS